MAHPTSELKTIIIPAAGMGTRMLPATRVTAKELLPVYDRPVIQFAIDEAIEAGADRIIVVVSPEKPAIREYLGQAAVASTAGLAGTGTAQRSPEILYVSQYQPLGLGHAVLCCKGLTLPGPFGIILPDDVIMGRNCISEMIDHYQGGQMIAAMKVSEQNACHYGIFKLHGSMTGNCIPVTGMVEKPPIGQAPSSIAAVGRYILEPEIFDILDRTPKGAGGEFQLTDAIAIAARSVALTAFRFSGSRYDCGTHDGLLAASNARQAAVKALGAIAQLPSHTPGIPKMAEAIAKAIYRALDESRFERIDMIREGWASGQSRIVQQVLLSIELSDLPPPEATPTLTQLPTVAPISNLSADDLHALVCKAALHAFAADDEARMEAMSGNPSAPEKQISVISRGRISGSSQPPT
ncbi:UTP--glucose-1-phosphate uridylyltransferase [Sediminimonas sp.]|uniref:UTP--glucose-1-phosphate uridylyltransferase n=1 Tax=Sediminimonas sp. TaxID=2823379 RepID=UPI0025DAE073|nr:sugar phosphate nucleotidyltransferase [Sediminimonas sp.]